MRSILLSSLLAAAASGQTARYIEVNAKSVKVTDRSGFAGPQQTVREPGFHAFLHGLEFAEVGDKPCYVKAHWWRYTAQNQPSAFTTQFDICDKAAKVDDSLVFATKPDLRLAIDSVRVCSNNSDNHRMKGVVLTAASIDRFDSGKVENALQKDSFDHANCADWKAARSCESGKVAIAVVIDHSKDEITGLSLKCAKPEIDPVKVSDGGSPQERYAKMEADIRVTVGKDGQSEIMTIREAIDRHEVAGATVVVLEDGEVSVVRRYGLRNKKKNLPTNKDTIYQTASISKLVGAIAMLTAARRSHGPGLDQSVAETARAFPDSLVARWGDKQFKSDKEEGYPAKITVKRLLSHTAGLDTHGIGTAKDDGPTRMDNILLGSLGNPGVKPISSPGSDWQYSGGGYTVAEAMLEAHTGEPASMFLQNRVLTPLGMTRSTYAEARDNMDELARGCSRGLCSDNPEHTMVKFAGGLLAHPEDYAHLLSIILKDGKDSSGRQVIPLDDIHALLTPAPRANSTLRGCASRGRCPADDRCYQDQCIRPLAAAETDLKDADWYGLGVWLSRDDDFEGFPRVVYHGGAHQDDGTRTHFEIDRKNQNGILVMINGEYSWTKKGVEFGADALKDDIVAAFGRVYP